MVAGCLCLAATARAEIIMGQHTWDSGGHNWASLDGWSTVDSDGNPTWLKVSFPQITDPETPPNKYTDIIYTQAENLFAGTWTTDMYVRFDFWAEDVAPQSVQLVWKSSTNATVWGHSFTPGGVNQTNTYSVGFGSYSNWQFPGDGGLSQYLSDLSTIDWIGIFIARTGDGAQDYGIDDVTLAIPEPPEIIMFGSAVLASLASLRRRRRAR
jgi:hypothetical protein